MRYFYVTNPGWPCSALALEVSAGIRLCMRDAVTQANWEIREEGSHAGCVIGPPSSCYDERMQNRILSDEVLICFILEVVCVVWRWGVGERRIG